MANRSFIVAYDISDPKRLRRVFKLMKGYGERWQKSVFYCDLGPVKRQKMETRLREIINHGHDQVLIVDMGSNAKAARESCEALGRSLPSGLPRIMVI